MASEVLLAAPRGTLAVKSEDSPRDQRREGKDKQSDAYWRLDCPTSGTTVEAYWPDFDSWLPAKFVRVNPDGSFCVVWKTDNSMSVVPTDYVRKVGDQTPSPVQKLASGSKANIAGHVATEASGPPLMKVLRKARPNWSDRDVYAAADKLKSIQILEVGELLEAVQAELAGEADGVNKRLQQQNLRSFAEPTLRALLRHGERLLHPEVAPAEVQAPPRTEPRPLRQSNGAFSRHAKPQVKPQQVFDHSPAEENRPEPKLPKEVAEPQGGLKSGFLINQQPEPEVRSVKLQEAQNARRKFTWKRRGEEEEEEEAAGDSARPSRRVGYAAAAQEPERSAAQPGDARVPVEPPPAPQEAAIAASKPEEPEQTTVYCPRRHALRLEGAPYDMDCDRCGREMCSGENIWWCGLCGYDLCGDCHEEKCFE